MVIQEGQRAPDFTLYDDNASAFTLTEHLGRGPLLLLFFPGAFSTACATELRTVNDEYGLFGGKNLFVVGISTDSPFVLKEFKKVHKFQFPLLSDHDATVCARYGAKYEKGFTSMKLDRIAKRAAFIIDRNGIIRYAEVLENSDELPDFETVRKRLLAIS